MIRSPALIRLRARMPHHAPRDLGAGLLVAALAVPQSLGYAVVAGVPVEVGLYTLPPALLAYAFLGSSRLLFMGPISTISVLSGSIVRDLSDGDPVQAARLTSALAVVAGAALLVAGLFRVGWVARFLSEPIVTGFVAGLVVLVVVGEIPGLLGVEAASGGPFHRLATLVSSWSEVRPEAVAASGVAMLILVIGPRLASSLPWALIVLTLAVVVTRLAGSAADHLPTVGHVPAGLPTPWWPWSGLSDPVGTAGPVLTGGLAIAAVGIAEGLAAARAVAGPKETLDDNAELRANGVADVAAGLLGGMAVGGSLSKTAANARAGARTQLSGLTAAAAVVLVLLVAAPLLASLPNAVLSAVVVNSVWRLVQPARFRRFAAIRRNDFVASLVALTGVLVLGPLPGLLVAIGQSLLGLIYRSMQVSVDAMGKVAGEKSAWGSLDRHPERETVPGVLVIRPDAPVFWANAAPVFERIRQLVGQNPGTRVVVLDLEATNQMDTSTAELLTDLLAELRAEGRDLHLVRVFRSVRIVLGRAGLLDALGPGRIWRSISAGVKAAKQLAGETVAGEDADEEHIAVRPPEEEPQDRGRR